MYTDNTTHNTYPKTLIIRNHEGGLVWQVYHVQKEVEAQRLSDNATENGFYSISLEDYMPEQEETWPDWRDNAPDIIK